MKGYANCDLLNSWLACYLLSGSISNEKEFERTNLLNSNAFELIPFCLWIWEWLRLRLNWLDWLPLWAPQWFAQIVRIWMAHCALIVGLNGASGWMFDESDSYVGFSRCCCCCCRCLLLLLIWHWPRLGFSPPASTVELEASAARFSKGEWRVHVHVAALGDSLQK